MKEPALGMIEFKSIAQGILSADAMVKKAPVKLLSANAICPGKYMVIIAGDVADVDEALKAGLEIGRDLVINDLFIPNIHPDIIPSITGTTNIKTFKSIAIIETFSIASCVVAADIAAKKAAIQLVEMRLANGLGGKGYFVMTGELTDIQAAHEAAVEHIKKEGLLAGSAIIATPHPDLIEKGVYW